MYGAWLVACSNNCCRYWYAHCLLYYTYCGLYYMKCGLVDHSVVLECKQTSDFVFFTFFHK